MNLAQRAKIIDGSQKYKFYNYLKSDGTAYINTGLIPNYDTQAKINCYIISSSTTGFVFGSRTSSSSSDKYCAIFTSTSTYYAPFASTNGSLAGNYVGVQFEFDLSKNGFFINGVQKISYSDTSLTSSLNIFLFRLNQAGNPYGTIVSKIYSCRIYDNGTLVRDFVPAKRRSDGVVGMLDKVHNVFYTNAAGSGSFTIG